MLASLLAVVAFAATPCTSRQLLRKVVDRERFVFYPMASGRARWYATWALRRRSRDSSGGADP
jgi:hypothetical protein